MAERAGSRLARGRRFGVEVGVALMVIGALFTLRGSHEWLRIALGVLGIGLLVLALASPAFLARPAELWLALGDRMARVTTPIVLGAIYLLFMTPAGVLRRRVWRSPIHRDPAAPSYWVRRPASTPESQRSAMEHQF